MSEQDADEAAAVRRAIAARVPYLNPADLGRPEGRRKRVKPGVSLVDSYRTQVHSLRAPGGRVLVRQIAGPAPNGVPAEDTILITAWNPLGRPSTLEENEEANRRLAQDVAELGGEVVETAATMAPDRSWLEDTLVVRGLDVTQAISLASANHQPAFTTLGPESLTIRPSGLVPMPTLEGLPEYAASASATCPMRIDDELGKRCAMYGGPWVSASIHAAAIWQAHRLLLLSRLGCAPCQDGERHTLGRLGTTVGPITVPGSNLILASRHGGYAWR